jgi:uncharacterized protein YbbC (DUF1343 family)
MKSVFKPALLVIMLLWLWSCAASPSAESMDANIPGPHEEQQLELGSKDIPQEKVIVHTGLDVLEKMEFEPLLGKNVGVVTNHTAVNKMGMHLVDLLNNNSEITIKAIFAPEHGFRGKEQGGDAIPGGVDANTGAPIYSLYGAQREPNPDMLKGIDVLIFDIQDVGTRFYTYISTMGYVLEAGAKFNIPVMILDRPNPIGRRIDGNVLDEVFESFVGRYPIPIQYGLSMGELARMIVGEKMLPDLEALELHVVECEGWNGDLFWAQTDLTWLPPSPNMRNTNETLTYPGLCLLEGVKINEGRGTEYPFEYIGTPYMDGKFLARELLSSGLEGFTVEPVSYIPVDMPGAAMNPLFEGEVVNGVKIVVTHPDKFKAVDFLIHLLVITKKNYPEEFGWRSARGPDRLWGGSGLREMVDAGKTAQEIIDSYQDELIAFRTIQAKYLIY